MMRDDLASLDLRRPMIHAHAVPALVMLLVLILVMPFIKVSGHATAQSPNLLMNPDFEDEERWLFQDGVREIVIPPGGWFAFWRASPVISNVTAKKRRFPM